MRSSEFQNYKVISKEGVQKEFVGHSLLVSLYNKNYLKLLVGWKDIVYLA